MQHMQDTFISYMENFGKKVSVQHDPAPSLVLFPSIDGALFDAAIVDPQPFTSNPSSSEHLHPRSYVMIWIW